MNRRSKVVLLLQLALVLAALTLLAGSLSTLQLKPGEQINLLGLLMQNLQPAAVRPVADFSAAPPYLELLRPIFWAVLIISLLYAVVSPEYRRRLIRTAVMIVTILIIFSRLRDLMRSNENQAIEEGLVGLQAGDLSHAIPTPPPLVTNTPPWLLLVANLLIILALTAIVLFLWRRLRPEPDAQAAVVRGAEQALADLDAGGALDNVVMQCYVNMSDLLRRDRRQERARGMTPREFERHLARAGLRDEHIQRLTRLFEAVRYGGKSSHRAELEARDCLRAIIAAYGKRS